MFFYPINYVFQIKQDTKVKVLNMITEINESQSLVKLTPCDYKCGFDGKK